MKTKSTLLLALFALAVIFALYFLYENKFLPKTTTPSTTAKPQVLSPKTVEEVSDLTTVGSETIPETSNSTTTVSGVHNSPPPQLVANLQQTVHIQMFNEQPFTKELYEFFPFERIFVVMTFPQLEAGEYPFSAHWIDPAGKTINRASHTLSLKQPAARKRIFFWLELMKNGAFTEMFTGEEYRSNVNGTWKVETYLDHNLLGSQTFQIHD